MDITHYSFAFFVFVLLCALILLYSRLSRGKKKDDTGSFEKEQKLFQLYQNIEDMLASFEEYAEEAKKEVGRGLDKMNAFLSETKNAPAAVEAPVIKDTAPENNAKSKIINKQGDPTMKPEERIPMLIQRGMSKSEIAKELGLSIREVTLIMDIKKIAIPGDNA